MVTPVQSRPALARAPAAQVRAGAALTLRGVSKSYGSRQVLRDVRIEAAPGECVAIVGRSGCGKSTLLRLLAGLDGADSGIIEVDGAAPRADSVRLMFQDARLLPWKSVVDNVALGLPGDRQARRLAALQALGQVGLHERAADWPVRLSGGQRQRVALARALAHQPRLLLLDEPLGALDALTRMDMQGLIEGLWRHSGFTAVLVTHDVAEAIVLADRVVVIEGGEIVLDLNIDLPRPRQRAGARFVALEDAVLGRIVGRECRPAPPAVTDVSVAGLAA